MLDPDIRELICVKQRSQEKNLRIREHLLLSRLVWPPTFNHGPLNSEWFSMLWNEIGEHVCEYYRVSAWV